MSSKSHAHISIGGSGGAFSTSHSKSHVLAGVQDAYWSDDDADDAECPLCLEEMDISDLNFKPCQCGYQICRFCWHHIKENLNGLCPACRRLYSEDGVQFKPISKEDHKRLTRQKKQREKERKDLETLGRRHLANVRVVQRNVVYVVGIAPRFAKEELIQTLRSNEFFGQYGKISNVIIVKRSSAASHTSPGGVPAPASGKTPQVGLYITYHRREDAARAIAAVDGAPSPGGGSEMMRASYGTTKYCMSFLRGASCNDRNCMNLHEWGDEKDCFTKEDLTTLKHAMKDTETRSSQPAAAQGKSTTERESSLPRNTTWGSNRTTAAHALSLSSNITLPLSRSSRRTRQTRTDRDKERERDRTDTKVSTRASQADRKTSGSKTGLSSQPSSRPATPAGLASLPPRPASPADLKSVRRKDKDKEPAPAARPQSPASNPSVDSVPSHWSRDAPSSPHDAPPAPERPESAASSSAPSLPPPPAVPPGLPAAPPGLPAAPPGLPAAPPGLPPPRKQSVSSLGSPSQTGYRMSTTLQALVEDVTSRRAAPASSLAQPAPFPEFDRVLSSLTSGVAGDGNAGRGFSFQLDPKVANDEKTTEKARGDMAAFTQATQESGFANGLVDPFATGFGVSTSRASFGPPGLSKGLSMSSVDDASSANDSAYAGSFNPFAESLDPFAESGDSAIGGTSSALEDDGTPKMSRFGFARGRRPSGSASGSAPSASSPLNASASLHRASPLSHAHSQGHHDSMSQSFYGAGTEAGPMTWQQQHHRLEFAPRHSLSTTGSPLVTPAMAQTYGHQLPHQQSHSRFQPFDPPAQQPQQQSQHQGNPNYNELMDFLNRARHGSGQSMFNDVTSHMQRYPSNQQQQFTDPAIMSAGFVMPQQLSEGQYSIGSGSSMSMSLDRPFPPPHSTHPPGFGMNAPHPSGLSYPARPGSASVASASVGRASAPFSSVDRSQASGSAHVSTAPSPTPSSPPPLSSSDFPALMGDSPNPNLPLEAKQAGPADEEQDSATPEPKVLSEKEERKAAKKAAASERAAERARVAQEKKVAREAEKAKLAAEKALEKERAATLKLEKERDRLEKEKARLEKERERLEKEKAESERLAKEIAARAELSRLEKAKAEQERLEREQAIQAEKEAKKAAKVARQAATKAAKEKEVPATSTAVPAPTAPSPVKPEPESTVQAPLLSRMTKKNKPTTRPLRIPKEGDIIHDTGSPAETTVTADTATVTSSKALAADSHVTSRSASLDVPLSFPDEPTSVADLLEQIDMQQPWMNIANHPFFDLTKVNPAAKMPLEYGPLVHALSALSVGGGSFANNMPSGSIDNAVSSFQQLLETLTQTISDLLRLLPRTTWDDSSSFDGVLRDMLKGDDFLDDGGEEGSGKEDEVAALTLALERRARWMEVQLSKLEELHRDINTAAVRAVLSFNDKGWDRHGFLPRVGNTLNRFDALGYVNATQEDGSNALRPMTVEELEKKLAVAKEAAVFAETEMREAMEKMQEVRPVDYED